MAEFYLAVGDQVRFAKTVSESDVYLFAGITGDFAPNHVDEEYMRGTRYGRRIAHGALLIGFMSTASTMMVERHGGLAQAETPVSLGYDRIRFIAPVFLGDTVTVTYTITEVDPAAPPLQEQDRGHQSAGRNGRGRRAHPEVGAKGLRPALPRRCACA